MESKISKLCSKSIINPMEAHSAPSLADRVEIELSGCAAAGGIANRMH